MSAPNSDGTNNPQYVTGGQFGVVIDGSPINQDGQPAGTTVLGPIFFDTPTFSVSGNVTADTFIGNFAGNISNVATANYANFAGNAFAVDGANVNGEVAIANTVSNADQPNITSVGLLTTLSVSGNALITGNLTVSGNLKYVNVEELVIEDPIIQLGGGPNGDPLTSNDGKDRGLQLQYYTTSPQSAFIGWENANAYFVVASNVTVTDNIVTVNEYGNLYAQTFIGNLTGVASNATSANTANVALSVDGANVVGEVAFAATANSVAGANVSGEVALAATANIANIAYSVSAANVSGNVAFANVALSVDAANVVGNVQYANVALSVAGANVSGNVANADFATVAEFVSNATQSNITTLGTLTGLVISGRVQGDLTPVSDDFYDLGDTGNSWRDLYVVGNVGNADYITANFFVGNGSQLTGIVSTSSNIANVANTVSDNAQPNITSLGTLTALSLNGDITGNLIPSANITYDLGSSSNRWNDLYLSNSTIFIGDQTITANADGVILSGNVIGNVEFAEVANIAYSVSAANVTGNVAFANAAGTALTANVANSVSGANVSGAVASAAFATAADTVVQNNQPNITSVGTLTSLSATGNITGNFFIGNGSLLTDIVATSANYANFAGNAFAVDGANVSGAVAFAATANSVSGSNVSGEVAFAATANSVAGANVSGAVALATTANTVTTNAQPNITSVGTLSSLSATGNVTANFFIGNGSLLTGISGAANTANTVTNNAQPNITSVGTLTSLSVSGNINSGNIRTNANAIQLGNGSSAAVDTAVAIGASATAGSGNGVAIGGNSFTGDGGGISIGFDSLGGGPGGGIGIGRNARALGGGVSIGRDSSAGANGIGIGRNANANLSGAIVFNALGSALNAPAANTFTVKPIRAASTGNVLYYDNTSGEISFQSTANITSVGTLTSLSVSGNANVGNVGTTGVFATTLSVTGNANIGNLQLVKYQETVVTANVSGTITPDLASGSVFDYTLTGNITLNSLANAVSGSSATLLLKQDATGNRLLSSTMKFAGNIDTLSTTANAQDILCVTLIGSTYYAALTKGYE